MSDRLNRLSAALELAGADGFVSGSSVDVTYFTGSEDGWATLVHRPGRVPVLLVRGSGAAHVAATAGDVEVVAYAMEESPERKLAEVLRQTGMRRIAWSALRPAEVEAIESQVDGVTLIHRPELSPTIRRRKEPVEEQLLREAAAIADRAMAAAMATIRVGVREIDAAAALEATARSLGCEGAIAPAQCKAGLRGAFPDAPASARRFAPGELGFIDLGIRYRGYMGDMTRAFVVGDLPDEVARILETVDRVQQYARSLAKPGVAARDLDAAVRRAFEEAGFPGSPPHHLGHGMGLGEDLPRLVPTSSDVIEEGDWFTIEPGVYVPGVGGVRIEDVVRATGNGVEVISKHPRVTRIPG